MSTLYYFPCIPVFAELIAQPKIIFDDVSLFKRSTFRNRTIIAGANGIIQLSIPVVGGRSVNLPYKEIQIDYKTEWNRDHYRTLSTVYGNSPFFMYYKDELLAMYEQKPNSLFEWNLTCFHWVLKKLKLEIPISIENRPSENLGSDTPIERYFPNNYDAFADAGYLKYSQVFEDKIGFKPNLSILDLLFNAGPQTKSLLQVFNTKPSLKTMV
jgi:hypothetical protein